MSPNCIRQVKRRSVKANWPVAFRTKKKIGNSWIEAICASPCLTSPNWSESMEMFFSRLNGQNLETFSSYLSTCEKKKKQFVCFYVESSSLRGRMWRSFSRAMSGGAPSSLRSRFQPDRYAHWSWNIDGPAVLGCVTWPSHNLLPKKWQRIQTKLLEKTDFVSDEKKRSNYAADDRISLVR